MTDNRNATASWSGYLHQGKVGIFVALKKINELIEGLPESERNDDEKIKEKLESWEIIYENAEDFDIRKLNEEGNIEFVESRHQVKANKGGKNLNDYKKVLSKKLREKVKDSNPVEYTESVNKSIFQIEVYKDNEIKENKENKQNVLSYIGEDKRFLHTIVDVQGRNGDGGIMDKETYNSSGFGRAAWIDNPRKVRFYKYEDGKFYCDLSTLSDNLKNWSIIEIDKIIDNNLKSELAYKGLFWELDQEIRRKHANSSYKESGDYPILSFIRILEIIQSDNSIEIFEEASLRESFANSYVRYKENLIEENIDFTELEKDADKNIRKLYQLKKDEFYSFLHHIHPDKKEFEQEKNINDTGLQNVFLKTLLKIRNFNFEKRAYYCGYSTPHIPTTMNDEQKSALLRIVENENLVKEYFEGSFLINKEFNGKIDEKITNLKSITDYRNNEKNKDESTNWQENMVDDKKLYLRPNSIEMISVKKAIKKLNELNE